jgi:nucleotide-binding universal stress UspA family protein
VNGDLARELLDDPRSIAMKPARIVVGYDFSAQSEVALVQGFALAKRVGAELILAHVGPLFDSAGSWSAERKQLAYDALRDQLGEVRARFAGQGVRMSQALLEGEADEALVSLQREVGADLLVVGSHGRSGVRWLLLGSVAERAARTSPRSVLVARRDSAARNGFRHILVPTDFSDPSMAALDVALEVAAPDASVEVLHCWQVVIPGFLDWGGSAFELAEVREDVLAAAERRGRELLRRYERAPFELDFSLVEQPPRQGIHRRLETGTYDLVALGSRGHRGVKRWLLGSVAESIARHAPCSVLITHAAISP